MDQSPDLRPTVVVWDLEGKPPKGDWITVLWRDFGAPEEPEVVSIPKLLEEQADKLRSRFLAWIYDLGETLIEGKRLIDYLELRPGLSYWWLTLLAQKDNSLTSQQIIHVIKMLVLEDLLRSYSPSKIILDSGNKILAQAFSLWCKNAGLAFEWRQMKRCEFSAAWIKRLYHALPHLLLAVIYLLRHLKQRWTLKHTDTTSPAKSASSITFCSYFDNLDTGAARQGHFFSRYWTTLPKTIIANGFNIKWIHLYVQDGLNPTAKSAQSLITRFNDNNAGAQYHTTLDSALCWSTIAGTLCDYGRVMLMGLRSKNVRHYFKLANSNIDLWPFFKRDWRYSMYGATAISNCLSLNLFEHTLKRLPRQSLGLYLQENQAWEMAFIHAWKAAGHGLLIGVPHSTVRYWDLRYFFDPRTYRHTGENDLPLPDKVALNGPANRAACRTGGYPEEKMVDVEALRYLYLADLASRQSDGNKPLNGPLRVLVLGDYLPAITHQQLQWLAEAAPLLPPDTCYLVKPHPNCPVKTSDYPSIHLQVTDSPLVDLLGDCDVAYTNNITSAAVDAYIAGVPVVSMLDGAAFNMSPLRGLEGVNFISSPRELAEALKKGKGFAPNMEKPAYFTIDSALSRWKALITEAMNE